MDSNADGIKGVRDFITRGNVIDLAVGVIIGAAFEAIVESLVKDLITPIVGLIFGQTDFLRGQARADRDRQLHQRARSVPVQGSGTLLPDRGAVQPLRREAGGGRSAQPRQASA
jgi:hypothetical protein